MRIFATGDPHLSGEPPMKPMDLFGTHWYKHREKLRANWLEQIDPDDTVIVCGDISWADTLAAAEPDLAWLAALPGRKLLLRGNHDYWWTSLAKLKERWGADFEFLQNNAIRVGNCAVCGSRGWLLPSAEGFTDADEKIYRREALRLELSLKAAVALKAERLLCAMHYPPLEADGSASLFSEILEKYNVSDCVFGHVHGGSTPTPFFHGVRGGVKYQLVSCDTQAFRLWQVYGERSS